MKFQDKKNILRWSVLLPVILLISVFYFFRTNVSSAGGNNKQDTLIIDQLGYRPYDVKIAFVRAVNPDSFVVKNYILYFANHC